MSANQKQGESQDRASVVSTLSEERFTKPNAIEIPQISLAKRGGAILAYSHNFEICTLLMEASPDVSSFIGVRQ